MLTGVGRLLSKERELKMIWEVEKDGRLGYLVGSAHFFPYHFRGSLRRYMSAVETVLLEGPLDDASAREVVACGSQRDEGISLLDALDPAALAKIGRELSAPLQGLSSHAIYRGLFATRAEDLEWDRLRRMKPWMAFFRIWSAYLRKSGWTYSVELDALRIAEAMGKEVHFLETIEEQIEALDHVPLERIVRFLGKVDWGDTRREHARHYLEGDLEGVMGRVGEFPTFCESIVSKRDPVLFERMRPFLERGRAMALVGTVHCPGVRMRLWDEGYRLGPAGTPSAPRPARP